jgi:cyclopropane fatty-acyl-phospholipid synthase-like methyltransferase
MSVRETERVAALLNLIPPSGEKALDVGTRDGHMAKLLASRYAHVVALDINSAEDYAAANRKCSGRCGGAPIRG